MAFLKPNLPSLDMATWGNYGRPEKIRRMTAHWAVHGVSAPGWETDAPVHLHHSESAPAV